MAHCVTMLRQAKTYRAKPYVPVTSAAVDPYAEEEGSVVDDDRLDAWFQYMEAELRRYRSPFVAAEALLSDLRLRSESLYQPERLYVSTALRVLQACVPHLSKETGQVVQAAVHELLPCLLYTRRRPLATSAASGRLEVVTQSTYAGAFRLLLRRWQQCQAQMRRLERHAQVELNVMDRIVLELGQMWRKMCFFAWRTYCRQLCVRKARLRRRLLRATTNEAAPAFLRLWRQHAHRVALEAKTSRNGALQREVDALYPLEQEARSRHDHLSEETKENNRLAGLSLNRLEEVQQRLKTLESLLAETETSLTEHWTTWKMCMRLMFDDVGQVPGKTDQTPRAEYIMNITDTAAALSLRAQGQSGRMGLRHLAQLLLFEGEFGVGVETKAGEGVDRALTSLTSLTGLGSLMSSSWPSPLRVVTGQSAAAVTAAAKSKGPKRSRTRRTATPDDASATESGSVAGLEGPLAAVTATSLTAAVNELNAAVAIVARPVLSPLHLGDVLHHHEARFNIALGFLSTAYCGGHCSLFVPPAVVAARAQGDAPLPISLVELASADGVATAPSPTGTESEGEAASPSSPLPEEVKWGALMMRDVMRGMEKVQDCADMNERYLLTVRQGMMSSELEAVQGYLEDLYHRWSVTGVPLSQQKLESVWQSIVKPMEVPILTALYPSHGITDFTELVHYVTRVAEFSGCSLQSLVERLDAMYPYDTLDEVRILRRSDEAVELFRENAVHLVAVAAWLKEGGRSGGYNPARLSAFLEEQLFLGPEEAAEVAACARRESGDVVDRDDVEWLLLFAAPYTNPSPFTSILEKVAMILDDCTSFFQRLARDAATPPVR